MWDWISANSIWLFIVSGLVLILILFFQERARVGIAKMAPEKIRGKLHVSVGVIFWTIEGIIFLIANAALIALILSSEGVAAKITTATIETWFLQHGPAILVILLVGMGLWYLLKKFLPLFIKRVITRPVRGESREGMKKRAATLEGVFMGLGRSLIILFVLFTILSEVNVPIGPVLAGFGIVGIAVGFGAQYLIRDLIAGVFILLENQYRVGDVAKVADIAGLVEEVNLRKTVLRDLDGIVHHVPNGEIKVASNYTRHFSRVNMDISVSYGTDLDQAIKVINRVCDEMAAEEDWAKVIINKPQVLRVNNLGNSGIDIKILGDVKPIEQWRVMGELRLRIKKAFDAEDIEIPWPHTKVYFGNSPWDKKEKV